MITNPSELEIWYHGAPNEGILSDRFQVIENLRKKTDPGDLGMGIYFSQDPRMSLHYGPYLYRCLIDMSRVARIPNPYRLWAEPRTDFPSRLFRWLAFDQGGWSQEKIRERNSRRVRRCRRERGFDDVVNYAPGRMKTVHTSFNWVERLEASQKIRHYFLNHGYTGIAMEAQNGELVIFDPNIIKDFSLTILSNEGYEKLRNNDEDQISFFN